MVATGLAYYAQSQVQDPSFNPALGGGSHKVSSIAVQTDGKIVIGGEFTSVNGTPRKGIARLNPDGTLDDHFVANVDSPHGSAAVHCLALQSDGKLVVGGTFTSISGHARSYLGRLNPDGSLDVGFDPGDGPSASVNALCLQADGRLLVGGSFSFFSGSPSIGLGRVTSHGAVDPDFQWWVNPAFTSGAVRCLALATSGNIWVGGILQGDFSELGLTRLKPGGPRDGTFTLDSEVARANACATQADGRIVVGGQFLQYNPRTEYGLARLNADGVLDRTFAFPVQDITSILIQVDGSILVGGSFSSLGSISRFNIARLHADGTVDASFDAAVTNGVYALAAQPDGKILVAGGITSVGGSLRGGLLRLNNTAEAHESLSYANATLTWLRGGAAPEVWRTTFETSADGVDWTLLGEGDRRAGGWQLTGVSVAPGHSVRARGYVAGAQYHVDSTYRVPEIRPVIVAAPPDAVVPLGGSISFTVEATGEAPLAYQWLFNSVPIGGANEPTLRLPEVTQAHEGAYQVVVSNAHGSVTSTPAALVVVYPNARPAFTKGLDPLAPEDAGAQTVVGWATSLSAGPPAEAGQALTFLATTDNAALFASEPVISPEGTLTYRPAPNVSGAARVTVVLKDDGGTENGGQDTSLPETFIITVQPVNDLPVFTKGSDQTVIEDAGAQSVPGWATDISAGPPDEAGQALRFQATTDNAALFASEPALSPEGTLTYTPAPNASGAAHVTVVLKDDGGTENGGQDTSAPETFRITVSAKAPPEIGGLRWVEGRIELVWEGSAVLEWAETPAGPWQELPDAHSPFDTVPDAGARFYRLKR